MQSNEIAVWLHTYLLPNAQSATVYLQRSDHMLALLPLTDLNPCGQASAVLRQPASPHSPLDGAHLP